MLEAALIFGAYLVGSIPVGVLFARAKGVNLFEVGSGNVGATNVKRALGIKAALAVFVLDVAKGVVPAAIALQVFRSQEWSFGVGLAAIAGHCLSPFLRFRGGKGVATGLGVLFGSVPIVAACALGVFLATMAVTRWVSLSSVFGAVSVVLFGIVFGVSPLLLAFFGAMAAFLVYRHIPNLKRILEGSEPRFEFRDKGKDGHIADTDKPFADQVSGEPDGKPEKEPEPAEIGQTPTGGGRV